MEHPSAEKSLTSGAAVTAVQAGAGSTPHRHQSESSEFKHRIVNFFKKEIPERFGLGRWDSVVLLVVALGILSWVLLFGWFRTRQGVLGRPLQVGIVTWPGYVGGLVANNGLVRNTDSQFWQNDSDPNTNQPRLLVEFRVIDNNEKLIEEFKRGGENGGIDVMWSTVDSLAYQIPMLEKEGIRLRAFMQVDWSRGGDAIVARPNIQSVADLKGKRVARAMFASQWLLEHSLENEDDLTPEQKLAIIKSGDAQGQGSSKARADFEAGLADAVVLWEPDASDLTEQRPGKPKPNAHVLLDTSKKMASNLIADVMVAREEFLQDPRGRLAIKAFIKGWFKGAERANDDPMRAVQMLKQEVGFAGLEANEVRTILGKVSLSTLDDNERMFGLSGARATFDNLFDEASALWLKRGRIEKKAAAAEARDIELLKEVWNAERHTVESAGCSGITKRKLRVDFLGKTELGDEIRNQLDTQLGDLFTRYPEATFCVRASAARGKDTKLALDTAAARANAVVSYLAKKYDRRPISQFISETTYDDLVDDEKLGFISVSIINR